jgi:tungstate transport system ATP-binding protein
MEIKINKLKKFYNQKKILDIENLEFSNFNIHTIMGVNGSGKTSLLKIIAGLDNDYDGEIFYNGEKLSREFYKNITYVGQKPYLFKGTVYENLIFPLKIRNYSEKIIKEKAMEYLEKFGLCEVRNQKAIHLSSGEAQRLALGRAMIFNPALLILDEATANINEDFTYILEDILREETKKTNIILVTHNMEQAKRINKDILFLKSP